MGQFVITHNLPLCVPSPFKLPCSRIAVPFTVRRPESEVPLQPDLKVERSFDGVPKNPILGYPTKKWRFKTHNTLVNKVYVSPPPTPPGKRTNKKNSQTKTFSFISAINNLSGRDEEVSGIKQPQDILAPNKLQYKDFGM